MKKLIIAVVLLICTTLLYANSDGSRGFFEAILANDIDLVENELSDGINPNIKDEHGYRALWVASAQGHNIIVNALLSRGADVNAINYHGTTALWIASQLGNSEVVKVLLKHGADPNIIDNSGNTALFWASYKGHKEIVALLESLGAIIPKSKLKKDKNEGDLTSYERPSLSIAQAGDIIRNKTKGVSAAVEALFVYLGDPESSNREKAIRILRSAKLSGTQKPIKDSRYILKVIDLLVDDDFGVQLAAAGSLRDIGNELKLILDNLAILIVDESLSVTLRQDIVRGIGKIGGDAKSAVPSLIILLKKGRPNSLINATVEALGDIGPAAEDAVPMLRETLSIEDDFHKVRASTVEALGNIGPKAKEVIPDLITLAEDQDQHMRYQAIRALGKMEEEGGVAIPVLVKALNDPYKYAASSAAYSLASISAATDKVVDALVEAMNDGREVTSYAQALGEIGPEARKSVPSLIRIMRARSNQNIGAAGIGRYHAIMALGKIGGEEAIRGLKSMRYDRNLNVRDVVDEALAIAQGLLH